MNNFVRRRVHPTPAASTDGEEEHLPTASSDATTSTTPRTIRFTDWSSNSVIRFLQSQWRHGDWRDKTVLLLWVKILLICMVLLTAVDWKTPTDHVIVGHGQRIPVVGTDTIRIPMEDVSRLPSMVLFRFLESWSAQKLRRTGETALIQFGEQLRELMLLGSDAFQMTTTTTTNTEAVSSSVDSYKTNLFQQKIQAMAPWLRGDPTHGPKNWPMNQVPTPDNKSRAVVICAGDKQMMYLEALLHTIRKVHQSQIPIRIVYKGDQDLSPESRKQLQKHYSAANDDDNTLRFIDLSILFDLDHERVQLGGWNLKPFGMLAVPEAQVVLLDVDVLLLRPPELLFEQPRFQERGALFFRDRSHSEHLWTPRQFLLAMQPLLSPAAQKALVNGHVMNEHIQEAGVVLIDKSRRWRGLWTACLILGRWDVRRFIQRDIIYGDKEVYFTAFETIHEPYSFARYYPGVIGSVISDFHGDNMQYNDNMQGLLQPFMALCGRMLHFDEEGLPLWSNGGYLTREDDRTAKEDVAGRGLKPILFADGGDSTTEAGGGGPEGNQKWLFNHDIGVLCMFPNKRMVRPVKEEIVRNASNAVDFYVKNSKQGG
ncbi:Alpha-1,3-mannosyltransferase [Seminavis robusta]|uniref:Alpha-1,3-mannosyltransferase n=1 Tax=Seminavis robusta TaxID=568900 RepID=A0A9N8DY59_9STRA|nr:Alpha-1,3-mannosyltransferase [Seminavis robusta]|eukprot:Sro458_g147050.1 Alpha-1,3-mannosyltransferase (597) ;mRNA; r:19986-21776